MEVSIYYLMTFKYKLDINNSLPVVSGQGHGPVLEANRNKTINLQA